MMRTVARGVSSSFRASSAAASSNPCCGKVVREKRYMPNAFSRSKLQWRGMSVAASVPSDSSIPSGPRRRISKHERRAMVVSFVNRYRSANAKRFPSASFIQKHTGGSYYFIREILQELEHKSKFSPLEEFQETQDFPLDKVADDAYLHSVARQKKFPSKKTEESVSVSVKSDILNEFNIGANLTDDVIDIKVVKTSTDDDKACGFPDYISTTSANSSSRDLQVEMMESIGSHSAPTEGTQGQQKNFPGQPEGEKEDRGGINDTEKKDSQELPAFVDSCRSTEIELDREEASQEKPTIWGNLKTLALGIVSFWKNK